MTVSPGRRVRTDLYCLSPLPHLALILNSVRVGPGYLRKKSSKDKWQKRWFEANDRYLTYYKNEASDNLLACIDLRLVGDIRMSDDPGKASILVFAKPH